MILRPFLLLLVLCAFPGSRLAAALTDQVARANSHLASGHASEALSSYRALLTSPEFRAGGSPEIWYNRGLAEEGVGDAVAASLSFRRALLLDPTLAPARRALSATMATLGIPESQGWMPRLSSWIAPRDPCDRGCRHRVVGSDPVSSPGLSLPPSQGADPSLFGDDRDGARGIDFRNTCRSPADRKFPGRDHGQGCSGPESHPVR